MTKLSRKKSELVAEELTKSIVRGSLASGEKLRQDRIAKEFDVSQVTAREALLQLTSNGMAISEPRRGVCVSTLDKTAIDEIRLMRQALEPLALQHAVEKMSPKHLRVIEAIQEKCDAAESAADWEEANRAFHMALLSPSQMPRLVSEIGNLQLLYARHFYSDAAKRWRRRPDPDHHAIIDALREKNAAKACSVLSRHLARLS